MYFVFGKILSGKKSPVAVSVYALKTPDFVREQTAEFKSARSV